MDQLTIRGFDAELEKRLREEARREGLSLSRAAIALMRRGAGLESAHRPAQVIGRSLDHLFGTWDEQESHAFNAAVAGLAGVDEELWR